MSLKKVKTNTRIALKKHKLWLREKANGGRAFLPEADFSSLCLTGANLSRAYLASANFNGACLINVDLSDADLSDAKGLTVIQLKRARSLKGAILPDELAKEFKETIAASCLCGPYRSIQSDIRRALAPQRQVKDFVI